MNRSRIIFGIGTGRCGTRSLAEILNRQLHTNVSHEARPLLPWKGLPPGTITRRLDRMRRLRDGEIIGDVASFYLPYIEEIIASEPDVRVVCLKRCRDEVIISFCNWLDKVHPLPTNHWAKVPAPGWYHEPVWTQIFPHFETQDRADGIGKYWDEYYERAARLAERFPNNLRIFDWQDALNNESGQREMLVLYQLSYARVLLTF